MSKRVEPTPPQWEASITGFAFYAPTIRIAVHSYSFGQLGALYVTAYAQFPERQLLAAKSMPEARAEAAKIVRAHLQRMLKEIERA